MELRLDGVTSSLQFNTQTHNLKIRIESNDNLTTYIFEISSNDISKIIEIRNKILLLNNKDSELIKISLNGIIIDTLIDKNFIIESNIQNYSNIGEDDNKIVLVTSINYTKYDNPDMEVSHDIE